MVQAATVKEPLFPPALAAFAQAFCWTEQDRESASALLLISSLPWTWNLEPEVTTAGAEMPPRAPVNVWRLSELVLLAEDVGEGSVGSAEDMATVSRVVGDAAEVTLAFGEELGLTVVATVTAEDVVMVGEVVAPSEEVGVAGVAGSELTLAVAEELADTGSLIALGLGDAVEVGADPKVTVNAALAVAVPDSVTVTVVQVVQVVEASRGTT